MGRDEVLPKRIFGFVHPKFKTPALNIRSRAQSVSSR
jgi:hypothetical protein